MAGVTQEHDIPNGRVVSMWEEAGIQFRSNLLLYKGASVILHEHSYPHVAMLTRGVFDVVNGENKERISAPARLLVPAGVVHGFTRVDEAPEPAEVLCMWGDEWHTRKA